MDLTLIRSIVMHHSFILDHKEFLSKIETIEIIKQIEQFRKIDFKTISDAELSREISNSISATINGNKQYLMTARVDIYPPNQRFYRIRKLQPDDKDFPLKDMSIEQDAWNAPPNCIKDKGRLNNVNESLLYVSTDPPATVAEMKIQEEEEFCLIVYEAKRNIKLAMIGLWEDLPHLTDQENLKMRIINNFLRDEFTKDVGKGTEYLYRASEIIAKEYYDFPSADQDGWCYPSVAFKTSLNSCFRPEKAREVLDLIGVIISKFNVINGQYLFTSKAIASGFDGYGKFIYHSIDSDECKRIFPEMFMNNN